MCSAGVSSCHHVQVTTSKKRKDKTSESRKHYRIDLANARKEHGDWIPFGYNLDLLKNEKKNL